MSPKSLTECKHCGANISRQAKWCPQCGGPSPTESLNQFANSMGTLGCLMLLVGLGLLLPLIFFL